MKALVSMFFLAVIAVFYSILTINVDLFAYSALFADVFGISAIVYGCKSGKSIV